MEYMEDVIEKDPMAAYPPGHEDAPRVTGDKLIDAWERELAAGGTPDIAGDLGGDAAVQAWLKPKKKPDGGGSSGSPKVSVSPSPKKLPTGHTPPEPPTLELNELEFRDDFTGGFDGKS